MSIFSSIGSSIAGGLLGAIVDPITKITQTIASARVDLEKEKNNEKRIAQEERIKSLEARRDVLVSSSATGKGLDELIRALFSICFLLYTVKVVVFDITFGAWTDWSTPSLPYPFDAVMLTVLGFFFVDNLVYKFKR